jgi:hypothetical protein
VTISEMRFGIALVLIAGAIVLAMGNAPGWGWMLFLAFLLIA